MPVAVALVVFQGNLLLKGTGSRLAAGRLAALPKINQTHHASMSASIPTPKQYQTQQDRNSDTP